MRVREGGRGFRARGEISAALCLTIFRLGSDPDLGQDSAETECFSCPEFFPASLKLPATPPPELWIRKCVACDINELCTILRSAKKVLAPCVRGVLLYTPFSRQCGRKQS